MGASYSSVVFNAFEQALSADLNRLQDLIGREQQDVVRALTTNNDWFQRYTVDVATEPSSLGLPMASVLDSNYALIPAPSGGVFDMQIFGAVTHQAHAAVSQGYVENNVTGSLGQDESSFQVFRIGVDGWPMITFATPDATNPRADIIYVLPAAETVDLLTRNVLVDPVTRTIQAQSVPKTENPIATLAYLAGTPAANTNTGATPAPPAAPDGATVLFEIYVPQSAVDATAFRATRRATKRIFSPLTSYHGILSGATLDGLLYADDGDESVIDARGPVCGTTGLWSAVIIDGELLEWPGILFGVSDGNAVNDPFAVAAATDIDEPYYVYIFGGQSLPQRSAIVTLGAYPVSLVFSLVPPTKNGFPSAAIMTPKGSSLRGLYVGVGYRIAGTTRGKPVSYDGDWVRAQTGSGNGGTTPIPTVWFNEPTKVLSTSVVTDHTILTRPNLSQCVADLFVRFVNVGSASSRFHLKLNYSITTPTFANRADLYDVLPLAALTATQHIPRVNITRGPTAAEFSASAVTGTLSDFRLDLAATAYKMYVKRLSE